MATRVPATSVSLRCTCIDRATNALIAMVNVCLDGLQRHEHAASPGTTGTSNIGPTASAKTYTVGIMVSNYYQRNSPVDNVIITVTRKR